ncbi:TorF family putative porin [Hyphomicrobium sp.]|uniref:TorF family putative porin n=1 Tax=Hyphomicrobium sp. TaxID=82 RepID=UPI002C889193|nr:TorF family putative porin [Hyphomicrobium sp.]HRN87006.1 TorF family putative porin [Hyphomicrobium sp.]HRQ26747.1 TorF family putative porin [Hyphomicrobium sp.]
MSKTALKKLVGATVGAAGLALCALTGSAQAESREFSWSVTGTGTSDYVFRGLSLNNEDPAFQASIDVEYGIWYAGLWGTMVDGQGYEPVELNFYTGIKPVLGPVTFDFGIVYYFYPWADNSGDSDVIELKAAFDWSPVKNLTFSPAYYYVPDQSNSDEASTVEGTLAYELPSVGVFTPTVSGLVGWTENFGGGEYTYWNAGLALAVDKFTFDFRYWDTDVSNDGLADERFVFTASITLP